MTEVEQTCKHYWELTEEEKEESRARWRAYYERNKESLKARLLVDVECECGCVVKYVSLSGHRKSKKHKNLIEKQHE
jgi:hypothetical protein